MFVPFKDAAHASVSDFQRLLLAQVPGKHGRRVAAARVFNCTEEPVLEELEGV